MDEAKRLGVKRLAVKLGLARGLLAGPVDRLADDRMAHLGQVDADLVGPPGFQPAGDQRGNRAKPLDDPEVGHSVLPFTGHPRDAPAEVAPVDHERLVDRPGFAADRALDHGEVLPLDVVVAKEVLEGPHRPGRPRQGKRSRRILVEPVDHADKGSPGAVAVGEVARRPRDQGIFLLLGGRLAEQACRLHHDQDVGIFVEDMQSPGHFAEPGPAGEVGEVGVGLDLAAGLVAAVAGEVDPAVADRLLRGASRQCETFGDQFIEANRHGGGNPNGSARRGTGRPSSP